MKPIHLDSVLRGRPSRRDSTALDMVPGPVADVRSILSQQGHVAFPCKAVLKMLGRLKIR